MAIKSVKPSVKSHSDDNVFVFNRTNYILLIVGLVFIVAGFILMAGGGTSDPTIFPASEIYSFRRTVLSPIVILTGFGIELYAIFKR